MKNIINTTPAIPVQVTRLQNKPMQTFRFCIPFLVVAAVFAVYYIFGTQAKADSSERVTQLQQELSEQQEIYHRYAPMAQQAKIAERQMTLANQRANTIREELKLLQGFQQVANWTAQTSPPP